MRALAMWQTSDRRQACGANHHGGGGLGQPPADATRLLTPAASLTQFDFQRQSLHDSGDSVARLGDDRQTGPDFLGPFAEPKHDPSSFAVGGKGLASGAGAANPRNKVCKVLDVPRSKAGLLVSSTAY